MSDINVLNFSLENEDLFIEDLSKEKEDFSLEKGDFSLEKEDFSLDKDDFDPPEIIKKNNDFNTTPTIKFMTPIRSREENFDIPRIVKPPILSPRIDLSDEDDINRRVSFLVNKSSDVNYQKEPKEIMELCLDAFEHKFNNLKTNYPEYNIKFPKDKSLEKIHKIYHQTIKSIYVNMNIGQTQLVYILTLMVLEFLAVKFLNIPMAGFTKMELKRMYKYNSLMIELGESMYPMGGGDSSPIEWRILSTVGWNVIIFLAVKIISSYVGGDAMMETIRSVMDDLTDSPVTKENIETGTAKNMDTTSGLSGMVEDIIGGGKGDGMNGFVDIISNLGTSFTEKMESKPKSGKAKKSRIIFNG